MTMLTYDPEKALVLVDGVAISGFADGTAITLAYDEPRFSTSVGQGGSVAIARNASKLATLTITLQQTSASNDVLSGLMQAHMTGLKNGIGIVTVLDASGRTAAAATDCYIENMAQIVLGKEITNREWVIKLARAEIFVGGN